MVKDKVNYKMSQSLLNRAMSFDRKKMNFLLPLKKVSIPLEQGNVFRLTTKLKRTTKMGLNPFGTGQCLSTKAQLVERMARAVSIPLEQGNVFRLDYEDKEIVVFSLNPFGTGQCLSTAAVCWRQESCGLSDPLPNFLGRLRN